MSGVGSVSSSDVLVGGKVGQGWWLVVDETDGPARIVSGPFSDRAEAGWAAGSFHRDNPEKVRPVYGFRREDGSLNRRPSPRRKP